MTSKKILVIDDNRDSVASVSEILEAQSYTVKKGFDGFHGFQMAQDFRPDVILLDIGLPDMNGFDVARRIRAESWGENILIIAATGWGQEKGKTLATEAGFDLYLTKPIDFNQLNKILQL